MLNVSTNRRVACTITNESLASSGVAITRIEHWPIGRKWCSLTRATVKIDQTTSSQQPSARWMTFSEWLCRPVRKRFQSSFGAISNDKKVYRVSNHPDFRWTVQDTRGYCGWDGGSAKNPRQWSCRNDLVETLLDPKKWPQIDFLIAKTKQTTFGLLIY